MPRELLMMQNSFQWGTAEGQTLEIENAIRSNVRDLKIKGQTYQNLLGETKDIEYVSTKSEFNYPYILENLKANTTYTLSYEIKSSNKITTNDNAILFRIEKVTPDSNTIIKAGFTGTVDNIYRKHNLTFNTESNTKQIKINLRNYFNSPSVGLTENTLSVRNLVLLEGDYTNGTMITELPTSINGIESVAEREKEGDLYPIKVAQSNNETDGIVLPNGVTNTIENAVHVKRVGKAILNGSEQWRVNAISGATITTRFGLYSEELINAKVKGSCLCDRFPTIDSDSDNEHIKIGSPTPRFFIYINKSRLSTDDVDGFKEYLSNNPILVYYELETPITEPCVVTEVNMPIPLRSLPNGVCDEVVGNKLIQRVGKIILDGSENWGTSGITPQENTLVFQGDVISQLVKPNSSAISDKFATYNGATTDAEGLLPFSGTGGTRIYLRINKSRLLTSDIAGFKKWLSQNPTIVYYELATPIEHTINVPPISISKGTNMVTTNNNIKPELAFKYKQSTKIIKYLYNSGNEYLNVTGGWNTQLTAGYGAATTIVKNTNNIYFPTGVWNMLLTNNKIDVTNYDTVYMKYSKEYISFNGHPARCAIKLGNKNTSWTDFANDATTGALIGKNETENNVTNGILTIDVSNVTGSYYVGIGGQSNNITVHEIGLKKENGDTITLYSNGNENTSLTGGYLTSSNSATCNIEKQVDNLYVNCTGKSNFDSICYARTNNYINPCKIKVSVKNNSISANGVAFCVFLSEKEAINSVSDFNSVVNKGYIKASNTTQGQYVDLEIDLTNNARGYLYITCMIAGSSYNCKANIRKIEIIR